MLGVSLALPVHPSLRLAAVVSGRVVTHHLGIRQHRRDEVEVCGFHLAQAQTIRSDDPCRGVWHSAAEAMRPTIARAVAMPARAGTRNPQRSQGYGSTAVRMCTRKDARLAPRSRPSKPI